jgi:hypothetical protein
MGQWGARLVWCGDCKHSGRLCEGILFVAEQLTNMAAIRNIEVMCGTSCCFIPAVVPVDV